MDKFEEEKLIMHYFRDFYTNFPKGKLVKSESPDFILKISTKKSIGIELTRLDEESITLFKKIEATLKNKSGKFKLYQRKRFNSIWLIIHADSLDRSKLNNLQNKLDTQNFETEFDNVYLFDLFENKGFMIK